MQLKVVKEEDKKLILEVEGEDYTLVTLMSSELWNDKSVSEAAFIKEHPYLAEPKIFVKTERGEPRDALEKAAQRIAEQSKEFKEEFNKSLKKS
jgi:DNA-directed RNA polymerase subunit L